MKNNITIHAIISYITIAIVSLTSTLYAQDGSISNDLIQKMRNSAEYSGYEKAIYNALINNDIKKLTLDQNKVNETQDLFNVSIKTKGITNQKSSGRCWLFASLNLLRPMMIEKYNLSSFEFSQNYLAFWDKLEKANMFLEIMILLRDRDFYDRELQEFLRSPFGDGGWWFYTVELIEKYGCVPKYAMPETQSSSKTGMMNRIISRKLRKTASKFRQMAAKGASEAELREYKEKIMVEIYRMLTLNLGVPPTEFVWRYEDRDTVVSEPKTYTPKEFYKDIVDIDLRDYVTIADHPGVEKYNNYYHRFSRNMFDKTDGTYLNLPIDSLKAYALRTLLDGDPVVFACDVGKDNDNTDGIFIPGIYDYESLYGVDLDMNKTDRFDFFESNPNHMMLLTACDTANGEVVRWKVENSWGTDRGDDGYWTMYDDWFNEHVFDLIVRKDLLSNDVKKMLKKEPIELPLWDPYAVEGRN